MYAPTRPSTFCTDELQRALTEQSFGITNFSITTSTSLRATAFVTLLEGNTITIALSTHGYSFKSAGSATPFKKEGTIFETIEALLQSVSTLYEQKRQEVLVGKLEKLC